MISKYFPGSLVVALNVLLFTSCLGSSDDDFEYSPDAQIYAFSLSSRADTLNLLNGTAFTIDQVAGKIFNKEPLPYLFHVDSVVINITGASSLYSPFTQVQLTVEPNNPAGEDSTYFWNRQPAAKDHDNRAKRGNQKRIRLSAEYLRARPLYPLVGEKKQLLVVATHRAKNHPA